jgi:hypothetical protein
MSMKIVQSVPVPLGVAVVTSLGLLYVLLTKGQREKDLPDGMNTRAQETSRGKLAPMDTILTRLLLRTGPPTVPVLGNIHQIPTAMSYLKYVHVGRPHAGGV